MERNTYRFFIPEESISADQVLVHDRDLAHQLRSVLRLRPGAEVTFLDGRGNRLQVRLDLLERDSVGGAILERSAAGNEPQTELTIYAALIKAERFEWLLQKATELGVSRLVPLVTARSLPGTIGTAKQARWQRIVREAAEQSLRGRIPQLLEPVGFVEACAAASAGGLLLWEGGGIPLRKALLRPDTAAPAIFSGPEGGFSEAEYALALDHGLQAIGLGPRILRAETAPLAAAAAILYERGDLG